MKEQIWMKRSIPIIAKLHEADMLQKPEKMIAEIVCQVQHPE
jgi:hypothetical protein